MANEGTLLSDLDTKAPIAGDGDLVKMIYQDMHNPGSDRPGVAMGGVQQSGMMPPPNQQATVQYQMDPVPQTAHIIGGQHPTAADFATMLQSSQPGFAAGGNWAAAPQAQASQAQLAAQIEQMQLSQGKQWYSSRLKNSRHPFLLQFSCLLLTCLFLVYWSLTMRLGC